MGDVIPLFGRAAAIETQQGEVVPMARNPTMRVSARTVARYLGVSPRTVQARAQEGRWPAIRVGRKYLFRLDEVLNLEARGGAL